MCDNIENKKELDRLYKGLHEFYNKIKDSVEYLHELEIFGVNIYK